MKLTYPPASAEAHTEGRKGKSSPARSAGASRFLIPALVCGLTVAALFTRLYGIGTESLWLDEAYTLLFSRLPLARVITVGGAHEHPPLYYLIVHVLLRFDNSALVPRLVAAVAGSLSVPVLFALGNRLRGPAAGLVAAALLTVSPFQLWYGQDGRAYTLAGLFVLLSYLCLLTALPRGRNLFWVAYALSTVLALYTEYTTAIALLPQALLAIRAHRSGSLRWLLGAWLTIVVLYLPWIGTLAENTARVGSDYWVPPPTGPILAESVLQMSGLESTCPTTDPCIPGSASIGFISTHEPAIAAFLVGLLLAVLAFGLLRSKSSLWLLTLWLLLPFALVLLVSLQRPLFLSRIFLDALFPLYLLIGWAVTGRRLGRILGGGAVLLLAAICTYNVQATYATASNGGWPNLMHTLQAAYRPGQAVTYYPGVLRTLGRAYVPTNWHPTVESAIWVHTYLDAAGLEKRWGNLNDNQLRPIQLAQTTRGIRQLWVVTNWYVGQWRLHQWLHQHGFRMAVHQWYGGSAWLELWDRATPDTAQPTALPDDHFGKGWSHFGRVTVTAGIAHTQGRTQLSRRFSLDPGRPYSVLYQASGTGAASPDLTVTLYSSDACSDGRITAASHPLLSVRPVPEEDFQQSIRGSWHSQPFGFVSPPGSACAVLRLRTWQGRSAWRGVAVSGDQS